MIRLQNLSFRFNQDTEPVLTRLNLEYSDGEFALICGPTGGGKSTLLKTINGLAPNFTGGTLGGKVWVNDVDVTGWPAHQLAEQVGYVNQQPEGAFVAETVDQEIAYSLEQLGKSQDFMFSRVTELAGILGLGGLLDRRLTTLSGGQQQRVAIASALAAGATTLLLDEPTSALDISATIDIVEILQTLAKSQKLTVLLAEHRIEKLLEIADTLTVVHGDGTATQGPLRGDNLNLLFNNHRMVPTVVEVSAFAGWQPTSISIQDARERWQANPLKARNESPAETTENPAERETRPTQAGSSLRLSKLTIAYEKPALNDCSLDFAPGHITAVMGPNGSGKTTMLWAAIGELETGAKLSGTIEPNFKKLRPEARLSQIALVPQRAADLLFLNSVSEELAESDRLSALAPGTTAEVLRQIAGRIDPRQHPRDLSAGQQLALVIALQLAKDASILLLDEPTRGLDYVAKAALAAQLLALKQQGKTVVIASHDIEFVASLADRVVVLAEGAVTHDGSAVAVLGVNGPLQSAVASIVGGELPPINFEQLEARYTGGNE
jgi:energy-coupling factor transport system ATP-binding protein